MHFAKHLKILFENDFCCVWIAEGFVLLLDHKFLLLRNRC
jgi:hypothetical protein